MFDIVAVAHAVVSEDVAEVPEFADNCGGGHIVSQLFLRMTLKRFKTFWPKEISFSEHLLNGPPQ